MYIFEYLKQIRLFFFLDIVLRLLSHPTVIPSYCLILLLKFTFAPCSPNWLLTVGLFGQDPSISPSSSYHHFSL